MDDWMPVRPGAPDSPVPPQSPEPPAPPAMPEQAGAPAPETGPDPAGAPAATGWVPPGPAPAPPAPVSMVFGDPVAVALGNASLLGVGYCMLRRWTLAVLTDLVSVVLLVLLATAWRAVWFEVLVALWWVALVAHGWHLARRRAVPVAARRQRLVAAYLAVPVLLAVTALRVDGYLVDSALADAKRTGDCGQAARAVDRVWFGLRFADAPLTVRTETTHRVCARLHTAAGQLGTSLATGDTRQLAAGFAGLQAVLAGYPGHEPMVRAVLTEFLGVLPKADACPAAAVTDWLRARHPDHTVLDTAAAAATRHAPPALLGCGDALVDQKSWPKALARYHQLLDQFPDSELVTKARKGIRTATLGQQLSTVRSRLSVDTGELPKYCSNPAKYEAATPYRKSHNRSLLYGNSEYVNKLPDSWSVSDAADAALVVCVGDTKLGSQVQTCPYTRLDGSGSSVWVTFYKVAIPIRAYELRTGKLVVHRTIQIGGSSCPQILSYTTYGGYDTGPDTAQYVTPSRSGVRAAFRSALHP
ncbi:hypothetical protein AB0I55_19090 [Actinocatenispora sera]|uniref:tetratricopeptide repeat protein n=1 Tax=Actinocatenispora sera TaxID=390989 RepID=UPI0033F689C3